MKRALFLLVPVVALLLMAGKGYYLQQFGVERTFQIEGFDPRDLLSGHYLTYRLVYQSADMCQEWPEGAAVVYCTDIGRFEVASRGSSSCGLFMAGVCERSRFVAGVERFYIPEAWAGKLERAVWDKRGSVVLSIAPQSGVARVKELLLDGRPWREVAE